jgi:Uma2 family endonuclease
MSKPLVKPEFYTYADYFAWPDAIRGELIDGQFCDMSPAPTSRHQRIAANLLTQLTVFFRGKPCCPYGAPFDVRLPRPGDEDGAERDVVQPDITLVCDPAKVDDRGCRGAPDWIIELLSPRTRDKDLTLKRDLYERHRVPMYWIVSPRERSVMVLRLDASGRYAAPQTLATSGHQPVAEYPGLVIDWDWAFERERPAS